MVKYWVFPEGYDPQVAEGPPTEDDIKLGITWTPEDTERMRAMKPEITDTKIIGRWHQDYGNESTARKT